MKNEGFHIDQITLVSDIMKALSKQNRKIPAEPRLMNCVIAAANSIVAEFAKPIVKATPGMGLNRWLDSDDTGSSSLFMAWILTAGDVRYWWGRKSPEFAYPRDPDDLGRCIRLISAAPELAGKIHLMHDTGPHWSAVADNWQKWSEMYEAEDETLYDAMQAAYAN